jgi:CheY-like chemotaxis protein
VAGAAIRATGAVVIVLNAAELAIAGRSARAPQISARDGHGNGSGTRRPELRVLVVDDSLTIRTLEKNLLQAAGYVVEAAGDGHQAWERLKQGGVDLVLSDIEMPHMDGIELVTRVRQDGVLRDLPFVLSARWGLSQTRPGALPRAPTPTSSKTPGRRTACSRPCGGSSDHAPRPRLRRLPGGPDADQPDPRGARRPDRGRPGGKRPAGGRARRALEARRGDHGRPHAGMDGLEATARSWPPIRAPS